MEVREKRRDKKYYLKQKKKKEQIRNKKKRIKERERKKEEEKLKIKKQKEREKKKREREKQKHKRKVGRPKKRGPKRNRWRKRDHQRTIARRAEKRRKLAEERKIMHFKVIACANGKQCKNIGKFNTEIKARNKINKLLEESKNVIFPIEIMHHNEISSVTFEYVLLEENWDGTKKNAEMRNEFGQVVEHKTSDDEWIIVDKFKFNKEEKFYIWGMNGRTERKPFDWIYENIILGKIRNSYDIKRIFTYKNKVIMKDDKNKMDVIMCKYTSDAIRFYNLLMEWIKRDKIKQVFFMGQCESSPEKKKKIEQELQKLTGWPLYRVQSTSTHQHVTGLGRSGRNKNIEN